MKPSTAELDAAVADKAEALRNFAEKSAKHTKASLEMQAAQKKLSLARSHEWALMNDLIQYSN